MKMEELSNHLPFQNSKWIYHPEFEKNPQFNRRARCDKVAENW